MATGSGQTLANTKSSPAKPDTIGLVVWHDEQTMHQTDDNLTKTWHQSPGGFLAATNETWLTNDLSQHWDYGFGGTSKGTQNQYVVGAHAQWDQPSSTWIWLWNDGLPLRTGYSVEWQFSPLDLNPYDYGNTAFRTVTGDDFSGLCKQLGYEYCKVQNNYDTRTVTYHEDFYAGPEWFETVDHHTYRRHAHTEVRLLSGGRAIPKLYILHQITGWVKDVIPALGIEAQPLGLPSPPYPLSFPSDDNHFWPPTPTALALEPNVPNKQVHIGGLGTLHDDPNFPMSTDPYIWPNSPQLGSLYCVRVAGAGPIDATPTVKGHEFYTFRIYQQRVMPNAHLSVNGGGTSPDQPFRFWVNDVSYSGDIISRGQDVPGSGGNGSSGQVNGRVDVVNFFPVEMHIGVPNIMPPDLIRYRLKGKGLYYTYTDKTPDNDNYYLTDDATSGYQGYGMDLRSPVYSAPTTWANGKIDFNATFTNMLFLQHNGEGVVLMTASKPVDPDSPLQLQAYWHNYLIYSTNLYLSISSVEDMYRTVNLRGGYSGIPSQPPNNLDVPNGRMFVFVHGYNVNSTDSRGWNAEMFKRLYWSGYHGMFTGVDWQGDDGQIPLFGITPDYYNNVVHAFDTAQYFAMMMRDLPGEKYVAAHSLGNMVVSSAIEDWSQVSPVAFQANGYFMIDAAVALEAYNAVFFDTAPMTHPDWSSYQDRLKASYWFQLFGPGYGFQNDGRFDLTWQDRFMDVPSLVNVQNYYSSTEDVLTNADGQMHSITSQDFCWVNQEMRKGSYLAQFLFGSDAGWGFGSRGMLAPNDAAALTDDQLRANSFFQSFSDVKLYDPYLGSGEAATPIVREHVLAFGIPALSNAAGGPDGAYLSGLDMSGTKGLYIKGLWPRDTDRWLHSDIKNIAYPFNHAVFDSIAGGLTW